MVFVLEISLWYLKKTGILSVGGQKTAANKTHLLAAERGLLLYVNLIFTSLNVEQFQLVLAG